MLFLTPTLIWDLLPQTHSCLAAAPGLEARPPATADTWAPGETERCKDHPGKERPAWRQAQGKGQGLPCVEKSIIWASGNNGCGIPKEMDSRETSTQQASCDLPGQLLETRTKIIQNN